MFWGFLFVCLFVWLVNFFVVIVFVFLILWRFRWYDYLLSLASLAS
jgi:hypothetical protein